MYTHDEPSCVDADDVKVATDDVRLLDGTADWTRRLLLLLRLRSRHRFVDTVPRADDQLAQR